MLVFSYFWVSGRIDCVVFGREGFYFSLGVEFYFYRYVLGEIWTSRLLVWVWMFFLYFLGIRLNRGLIRIFVFDVVYF